MRLLHRHRPGPRTTTARPAAEPYLAAGAAEARRLGHNYVGTEHVLLVLTRDPDGGAAAVLRQLGVSADAVEEGLADWLGTSRPKIDPDALAALGIDFTAVRERLEATFGPGALEQSVPAALASVLG
jgi:ATP-dependent Clp protease ATP-binding subunit ClpA